ncbi:MAG: hypothetical protein ABL921_35350, partial [Pirellula sp.]
TQFTGSGILVTGDRVSLQGNVIGTNASGDSGLGNQGYGIVLQNANEAALGGFWVTGGVGGDHVEDGIGNVVSGNYLGGVLVENSADVRLISNRIGTSPDGLSAVGNGGDGVRVTGSQSFAYFSGDASLSGATVISANAGSGIFVDATARGIDVSRAIIGLDESGEQPLGNGAYGIRIERTDASPAGRNFIQFGTISANASGGLWINDQRTTAGAAMDYYIGNNLFGLDVNGVRAVGNGNFGAKLQGSTANSLTAPAGRAFFSNNTASGQQGTGLWLERLAGWSISSSRFGTDPTGTYAIPNDVGLYVHNSFSLRSLDFMGVVSSGSSDLQASGNREDGIRVVIDAAINQFAISHVLVGTDATGTAAIPNARGISLDFSNVSPTHPSIHGTVSGNLGPGIVVTSTASANDRLGLQVRVGIQSTGDDVLPNRGPGIVVAGDSIDTVLSPESAIAYNRGPGIRHEGSGDGRNIVLATSGQAIFNPSVPLFDGNQGLAVDLGSPGPTTNSGSATDHPVITSASLNGAFLDVTGTNSELDTHFIQFYTTRPTVSGRGQGQEIVGPTGRLNGSNFPVGLNSYLSSIGAGPFLEDLN